MPVSPHQSTILNTAEAAKIRYFAVGRGERRWKPGGELEWQRTAAQIVYKGIRKYYIDSRTSPARFLDLTNIMLTALDIPHTIRAKYEHGVFVVSAKRRNPRLQAALLNLANQALPPIESQKGSMLTAFAREIDAVTPEASLRAKIIIFSSGLESVGWSAKPKGTYDEKGRPWMTIRDSEHVIPLTPNKFFDEAHWPSPYKEPVSFEDSLIEAISDPPVNVDKQIISV